MATRPLPIDSQLIAPKYLRTGTNALRATVAISMAAEPAKVPFIAFRPIAKITMAPPKVTRPFPISSQLILLILDNTDAKIARAAATAIKPTPLLMTFLGIRLSAIVIAANAPAIAIRPFAMPSHDIFAISFAEETNIFIAAAMAIRAIPVDITCFALPESLVNARTAAKSPATEARPFPISSQLIEAKSLQTDARIFNAAAKITIPVAVAIVFPLNLAVLKNKDTPANRAPTPTRPLAISSQL